MQWIETTQTQLTPLIRPIVQHKKSPITGEPMTAKDIIRLNMSKNAEGKWHCPVTFKVGAHDDGACAWIRPSEPALLPSSSSPSSPPS